MTTIDPSTSAESAGKRRKGPKELPKLPLHLFSPPNSGAADKFPLPPSPSAVHPNKVVDTHVLLKGKEEVDGQGLERWKGEIAGRGLEGKLDGIVVSLQNVGVAEAEAAVEKCVFPIIRSCKTRMG